MGKYSSVAIITTERKRSRRRRIEREDKPGIAGYETDHYDGRTDAVAIPEVVRGVGKTPQE